MEEKSAQIEEMLRFPVSVRIFYTKVCKIMKSEIPIYLQLRNQIVMGIGKGEFEEGELLPVKIRRIYRDGPQAGNCDLPSRI